jgi:hypothetical protein
MLEALVRCNSAGVLWGTDNALSAYGTLSTTMDSQRTSVRYSPRNSRPFYTSASMSKLDEIKPVEIKPVVLPSLSDLFDVFAL